MITHKIPMGMALINPKKLRRILFSVLAVSIVLNAHGQKAQKLLAKSKSLENDGKIEEAVVYAEKAVAANKNDWQLWWNLGELILYKTDRKADALAPFTQAFNLGYQKPITYHKQAMCYFHLGDYHKAIALLNRSIEENVTLLNNATQSKNDGAAKHARFQIADSYVWLTKQYEALEDPENFYITAKQVELYDPKNQWAATVMRNGVNMLMYDKIIKGDYPAAIALCKEEIELTKRLNLGPDTFNKTTFLEILENRARLGNISPLYTHKMLAVYFNRFEASYAWKGQPLTHARKMTDHEKHIAMVDQKILTMIVESLSNGALSVSWDSVNINEPVRDVKLYEANDMVEPLWPPNQEFCKVFKERYEDFDTFFMVWNGPTSEAIGGAGSVLPGFPQRGTVRIHPDHGTDIWIHEFFHTLEFKVGISPAHGFRQDERKSLPEWKGETNNELDYYRWHFNNKIKNFGYEQIRFR